MRDPKRIKPLLKALEKYWVDHPDLRLGQIISNANALDGKNRDIFYIEDVDLLVALWELP